MAGWASIPNSRIVAPHVRHSIVSGFSTGIGARFRIAVLACSPLGCRAFKSFHDAESSEHESFLCKTGPMGDNLSI
jgi:hypothetical protein